MTAITIGNGPIPDIETPTFQVFVGGELVGYAAERRDRGHLDRRCWTACVNPNSAYAHWSADQTLKGIEGIFYVEAPTRELLCQVIERRFAEFRRQQTPQSSGRRWLSRLKSRCQQLLASPD